MSEVAKALVGSKTLDDYGIRNPNPNDNDLAYYLRSRAATKRQAADTLEPAGAVLTGVGLGTAMSGTGPIGLGVGSGLTLLGGWLGDRGLQAASDAERYRQSAQRWRTLDLPYRIGIEE